MRLKLTLRARGKQVGADYFYPLSSAIYRLLRLNAPDFTSFLHDTGFQLAGKKYKLFVFALKFRKIRFSGNNISLLAPEAELFISTPLIDDFIKNFVVGALNRQNLFFAGADFDIELIESLPDPAFRDEMKFRLLSPLVLSTKRENKGKMRPYYYRYDDPPDDLNRAITGNLANKYTLIFKRQYDGPPLSLHWDQRYINDKLEHKKRITNKQKITADPGNPIEIIGNIAPFTLKGDPNLIKTGYISGFGEKNSMGFGMGEVVGRNNKN